MKPFHHTRISIAEWLEEFAAAWNIRDFCHSRRNSTHFGKPLLTRLAYSLAGILRMKESQDIAF